MLDTELPLLVVGRQTVRVQVGDGVARLGRQPERAAHYRLQSIREGIPESGEGCRAAIGRGYVGSGRAESGERTQIAGVIEHRAEEQAIAAAQNRVAE